MDYTAYAKTLKGFGETDIKNFNYYTGATMSVKKVESYYWIYV